MPCGPAAFLQKASCKSLSCCAPQKALWILLGELQVAQLYNGTANPLGLVSCALVRVEPLCRLPIMTPQTSFDRTCHCSMCDGERTGCLSFLGEPPPCDGGRTIKRQWFSRHPHLCWQFGWCCLRGIGSLCLPVGRRMLSLGNGGDTSTWSSECLVLCVHFCRRHTGNKAFIFH